MYYMQQLLSSLIWLLWLKGTKALARGQGLSLGKALLLMGGPNFSSFTTNFCDNENYNYNNEYLGSYRNLKTT